MKIMSLTVNVNNINTLLFRNDGIENNSMKMFGGKSEDKLSDMVKVKKDFARSQARRLIENAFSGDEKQAESIEKLKNLKGKLSEEKAYLMEKLDDIDKNKKKLKEEYGINDDSKEQKDLELLYKFQDALGGKTIGFSKEEMDRLYFLQDVERTEYQKQCLRENANVAALELSLELIDRKAEVYTKAISDAEIEQLKNQSMEKADRAADDLMEAASEEVKSMIAKDAVEKENERIEKEEEKQEKIEEEKEKEAEREEKEEEREELYEVLSDEMKLSKLEMEFSSPSSSDTKIDDVQRKIKKIMEENNLISEELKGLEIDLGL